MWALVHEIYEAATPEYPVVRHVFYGKTQAEAKGIYAAHRKTDAFLRSCDDTGEFKGIDCQKTVVWLAEVAGPHSAIPRLRGR